MQRLGLMDKMVLICLINALKATAKILTRVLLKADFWNRHSKTIINERQKKALNKLLDGFIAFTAKTQLIEHYEKTLGAFHFKNQRMIIDSYAAKRLVEKYFKTQ
jgi:hypothetical protein